MNITVRVIFGLLIVTLSFGVWGIFVLGDEASRRRSLWDQAIGTTAGRAARLKSLESKLITVFPLNHVARKMAAANVGRSPLLTVTSLAVSMAAVVYFGQNLFGRIASSLIAISLPFAFAIWLKRKALQRRENFIAQLPEVARIIANGNAAGLSIGRCLAMVGREMSGPAGEELRRVAQEIGLGQSVDQSMKELSNRFSSREVDVLMRTILIQSRTGGALSAALTDISQTLDNRKELRREVGTVILGASVSGYAVMGIGVSALVLINLLKPGVLDSMASSTAGQIVMAISATLYIVGALLMRMVSRVDV